MTAGVEIRAVRIGDVPAMHAIRSAVRENQLSEPARIVPEDYRPFIEAGSAWIAQREGRTLGFAAIDPATATVWALFVDPAAEGGGAGRALHERMLEWARDRGIATLFLTTGPGTRADRFYRENGWAETGRDENGEIIFERQP